MLRWLRGPVERRAITGSSGGQVTPPLETVHVAASAPFCSECGRTVTDLAHFGPNVRILTLADVQDVEDPCSGTFPALARSVFKVDPESTLYEEYKRFPGAVFIQLSDKILADAVKCAAWHQKCVCGRTSSRWTGPVRVRRKVVHSVIELGDRVRCKVTGFEGVAIAKQTALYEVTTWRVQPVTLRAEDGSIKPHAWLEEGRLEVAPDSMRLVCFVTVEGDNDPPGTR